MSERLDVITGVDYERNGEKKTRWSRIGIAFKNQKGGWDVTLDALPVSGKLKLVEQKPREGSAPPSDADGPGF